MMGTCRSCVGNFLLKKFVTNCGDWLLQTPKGKNPCDDFE